eukprot:333774-Amphidinium_carterae.1
MSFALAVPFACSGDLHCAGPQIRCASSQEVHMSDGMPLAPCCCTPISDALHWSAPLFCMSEHNQTEVEYSANHAK